MIDDEQTIRLLVAEALFEAGYAVDVAANGAEALERMRLAIPDAVILDVMMPRLDGYGFVEQVRRKRRHLLQKESVLDAEPRDR